MELHQLRYVLQVAKRLNFSRAADELCVTQPTLSHQILKLEGEIGVALFERKTRAVKLTLAGEKFVVYAEKVLAELEALGRVMEEYRSLSAGDITIGTLPVTGTHGLITYVPAFQKHYPGIHIRIIEAAGSQDLIKLLQAGSIDVACLIPQPGKSYEAPISFYPLIKGKVVLITCKDHRFVGKEQISLSDAAEEFFILPPRTHSMYSVALHACRTSGFEPKIACECGQLNTVFELVAKGLGIAFVSSQSFEASSFSNISVVPFEPLIERTLCLAVLEDKEQLPVIAGFRDFILKALVCLN